MQTYGAVCKLLGAFLEPSALWAQLKAALDAECAMDPGACTKGCPGGRENLGIFLGKMEETG